MSEHSPAEGVFYAALGKTDPAERAAYLDEACAGQPDLRARVEKLLADLPKVGKFLESEHESDSTDSFLPRSPDATGPLSRSAEAVAGIMIAGKYKLLQQIGEGGMGSVWMADQTESVKRRVAVKLIRSEKGSSKTILARFEAERQAIALMDHPNVAKLLDAGTTAEGQPFFVMELVKGIPLSEFCDSHKLGIPERLALFMQICSAVQHAHQKGIIHRDLKPSNILVESHDGKPVPKVIDFGLAKATTGLPLTEQTLFTGFGTVLGTPLYMAPEQASFNAIDIDTRADVYALGVILYELLTGTTPLTRETMKKAALEEVLRLIREQDAPTPSSRWSSSESAPSAAANRQIEPGKLGRLLRGDLDWIVMKALSKDRDRRYEAANSLGRDLERFLNHEPVIAGPPTARYRLGKFVRRNRLQVVAGSLVFISLVLGVIGTTLGLVRAESRRWEADQARVAEAQQRAEAEKSAAAERKAKDDAEAKRKEAETNLGYAKKGNEILSSVFLDLDPNADYATVAELRSALRDNLKKAVKDLEGSVLGDPVEVAGMQNTLDLSLLQLGEHALAVEVLQKSVGTHKLKLTDDNPATLISMNNLAQAYLSGGQHFRAVQLYQETLKKTIFRFGPDHAKTLACMNNMALAYEESGELDKAVPLYEETLKTMKAVLGPDHPKTLTCMNGMASAYHHSGQLHKALPLFEETLEKTRAKHGPDHPSTLASMGNLAMAYQDSGQFARAVSLFEETLEKKKNRFGLDHANTLSGTNNLAGAYLANGQSSRALQLLEETLPRMKARVGSDHPQTLRCMDNLGTAYRECGQFAKAVPLFEETLEKLRAKLGTDHPLTLNCMNNLAGAYQASRQLAKAVPLFEKTLEILKDKLGPNHPSTLACEGNLASAYRQIGQVDKAVELLEVLLEKTKAKYGPDHHETLIEQDKLAMAYKSQGRLSKAVAIFEDTLEKMRAKLGTDHPSTINCMGNLGRAYLEDKQGEKATQILLEYVDLRRKRSPKDSADFAGSLATLSRGLIGCGQYAAAERLLRECITIREMVQPNVWSTFNAHAMLGWALLSQKKYAEAEPLLLKGYEGMKSREKTIPLQSRDRLPEALDQLIELYSSTNKPDEVAKWQAERVKYPDVAPLPREKK